MTLREILDAALQEGLMLDDEVRITIIDDNDNVIEEEVNVISVDAYSKKNYIEIKVLPEEAENDDEIDITESEKDKLEKLQEDLNKG